MTLAEYVLDEHRRGVPVDIEILEIADDRFAVCCDRQQFYMGTDGRFYSQMSRGCQEGYGYWFRTRQEALDAIHRHYPSLRNNAATNSANAASDRTKMSVADLAREMAALVPDCWALKSHLMEFADSLFLELPESRRELLQRLAEIVNRSAAHTSLDDLKQTYWPDLKAVFLSAFGEPK